MIGSTPPNRPAELKVQAEAVRAAALELDTTHTEPVTAGDLERGDIILSLGGQTFPFPFTLDDVRPVLNLGLALTATHGWFAPLIQPTTSAVRLVRTAGPSSWLDAAACERANRAARFLPMTTQDTLPCLEVAGVQVYAYLDAEDQTIQVSIYLDDLDPALRNESSTVPLVIDVGHHTLFRADGKASSPAPLVLLAKLVAEQYGGDATRALVDLAHLGEIAVNYLDREWFTIYLHDKHAIELTDARWSAVAAHLSTYDAHISDYEVPNVQSEFAENVVRAAGLVDRDDCDAHVGD